MSILNCSGSLFESIIDTTTPGGDSGTSTDYVEVSSVLAINNTTIKVIFDEAITKSVAEVASNYSIDNGLSVITATRDISDTAIIIITTTSQTDGTTYTITATNITGTDGSVLDSSNNDGTFTGITSPDVSKPQVINAVATSATNIDVKFNESILDTSLATGEFVFSPTTTIGTNPTGVSRDAVDYSLVHLTVPGQKAGTLYTVTVGTGVTDLVGNGVDGALDNSAQFNANAGDTDAPILKQAQMLSPTILEVEFSEDVDMTGGANGATNLANYTIDNCQSGAMTMSAVASSSGSKVVLTVDGTTTPITGGDTCRVTANNVNDLSGNTIINRTNKYTFAYISTNVVAPQVANASPTAHDIVKVTFNEHMGGGVTIAGNYTFTGGLTAQSVVQDGGTNSYLVTLDYSMTATSYTVTVTGVQDANGNTIGATDNTATFTGDAKPAISSILVVDNTHVRVVFSEILTNAGLTGDYDIGALGNPTAAVLGSSPNDNTVLLTTSVQTGGTEYTVTLTGTTLVDANSNTIDTANNADVFTGDGLPTVTGASEKSVTTVEVEFSESVDPTTGANGATNTANYAFSLCANIGGTPTDAAMTSATKVLLTFTDGGITNSDTCTVTVSNVNDLNSNTIGGSNTANFTHSTTDSTAPTVNSAVSTANTKVQVAFSEPVDITNGGNGAENTGNYSLTGGLSVTGATCSSSTTCELTTDAQSLISYTVTVSNVNDAGQGKTGNFISQCKNRNNKPHRCFFRTCI